MRQLRTTIALAVLCVLLTAAYSAAQEEATAAWLVTKFDITVSAPPNERAITSRAVVTALNVGRGQGTTLSLRISPKAEIKSVTYNGATATFTTKEETRTRPEGGVISTLQRITISLGAPVAPGASATVTVDYRLPVGENSSLAALSAAGSQFLPRSYWYPAANALYALRGADAAPVRLTVNGTSGDTVISSGSGAGPTLDQSLNVQPFFLTGSWDAAEGSGEARGVSAYMPKGAGADERKRADELIALAASARTFYAGLLGAAPDVPLKLVAVKRGAGFSDGGTILLDTAAFRRTKLDSVTSIQIAEGVARLWVGGLVPIRGEGGGIVREGLTRFLATLFFEKQFGREMAEAERTRERVAYGSISKIDPPLMRTGPLDPTYQNAAANKGAMVWRLAERALGRDATFALLRAALQRAVRDPQGISLASLRAALAERGGESMKALLDLELDQPTDMDLLVGLPQQRGAQWVAALRNTGAVDAVVTVLATTASGERLTAQATIPARNFGEAVFNTANRITRVEVDPDKLYPQTDYTNDVAPRPTQLPDPLVEAMTKFAAQNFAEAEAAARQMLAVTPSLQEARIQLARALLAQNKADEAEKEFKAALDDKLPSPNTLAWANIGLGEIALKRGQAAEAARRFNDAVRTEAEFISKVGGARSEALRTDSEYASRLAARLGRIRAEAAANAAPAPDEAARAFVGQLDQAIRSGKRAELETVILPGELITFMVGIVGSQPEAWATRVVRTEQLDANRMAADVTINMRELGKDKSGTAVLILQKVGGAWKLAGVELFEVR